MRKFERDFKLSIVRRIAVGQLRKAQACREYSLSPSVLDRWCAQYEKKGEEAFKNGGGSPMESADEKIKALENSLGRAHLEIEFLKEALSKKVLPPEKR